MLQPAIAGAHRAIGPEAGPLLPPRQGKTYKFPWARAGLVLEELPEGGRRVILKESGGLVAEWQEPFWALAGGSSSGRVEA